MDNQISFRPYEIGCMPSPSVPGEVLMQDGWTTFLLFHATSKDVSPNTGYLEDLGVAVVECVQCVSTKFGYPNDEGMPEHPLWTAGLGDCEEAVIEVLNSPWNQQVEEQRSASYDRILGIWPRFSQRPESRTRHFLVPLKEATFECLADEMKAMLFAKNYDEAFAYVIGRMKEH